MPVRDGRGVDSFCKKLSNYHHVSPPPSAVVYFSSTARPSDVVVSALTGHARYSTSAKRSRQSVSASEQLRDPI